MVRLTYYTDPAYPWSWAAAPALRRLQMEFGEDARITYVMAGMERELEDPVQLLEVSTRKHVPGMPGRQSGTCPGPAPGAGELRSPTA
jgi:hypothetical protein